MEVGVIDSLDQRNETQVTRRREIHGATWNAVLALISHSSRTLPLGPNLPTREPDTRSSYGLCQRSLYYLIPQLQERLVLNH